MWFSHCRPYTACWGHCIVRSVVVSANLKCWAYENQTIVILVRCLTVRIFHFVSSDISLLFHVIFHLVTEISQQFSSIACAVSGRQCLSLGKGDWSGTVSCEWTLLWIGQRMYQHGRHTAVHVRIHPYLLQFFNIYMSFALLSISPNPHPSSATPATATQFCRPCTSVGPSGRRCWHTK